MKNLTFALIVFLFAGIASAQPPPSNDDRQTDTIFESPSKMVRLLRAHRDHEVTFTVPEGQLITVEVANYVGRIDVTFNSIYDDQQITIILGRQERARGIGGRELTLNVREGTIYYITNDR